MRLTMAAQCPLIAQYHLHMHNPATPRNGDRQPSELLKEKAPPCPTFVIKNKQNG